MKGTEAPIHQGYQVLFDEIYHQLGQEADLGEVAQYIPELRKVDPGKFGVHLTRVDGRCCRFGDYDEAFSIQSIAKVLGLALAYCLDGDKLWHRVGVEPSGTPFNSLFLLEREHGKPRNPLINAGALVISDMLISRLKNPKADFIDFVRKVSNNPSINYSEAIAESEKATGFRNVALANLMRDFGNLHNDIDEVLDFYYNLCSIMMTCQQLCSTFLFLAGQGTDPVTSNQVMSHAMAKRINAIMQLCGFYDEAGEFAYRVGLPGKSGVGGGIIAIYPQHFTLAVWSPRLNAKGNSYKGIKFLEKFTDEIDVSVF